MSKLFVFELDGGTWEIMTPMLEKGELPHFASLIQQGAKGILHSVRPLMSPALWTSIYTGQPREEHGVTAFDATTADIRYARIWDIAHRHQIPCGILGSMVTWPPYDVGGFMIPDIMARDAQTIPPQFSPLQEMVLDYPSRHGNKGGYGLRSYAKYALALVRLGIRVDTIQALVREVAGSVVLRRPHRDKFWRRALLLQEIYADAFLQLYRSFRPGISAYHYHAVDTLSHWYWPSENRSEQREPYDFVLPAAYQAADQLLGRLLDGLDPDTTVIVVSDHGFAPNPEIRPRYKARLARWIEVLGLKGVATPTRLAHQHFLYFRDRSRQHAIYSVLSQVHFKDNGELVFPKVECKDDAVVFAVPIVDGTDRFIVIPGCGESMFTDLFEETGELVKGSHDPEGIVIITGSAIRPGTQLEKASILDVAPTVLTLLDLPLAHDMPGRIWKEALLTEYQAHHTPTYVDTYRREDQESSRDAVSEQETDVLLDRLQDLGYL